ncbi:MAG TPA: uracil-DNA glycosylase family protein [Candidatus Limnocylindrales bacterium]|nr:uracil-DNA glycosylase family protein [Candidatus Limnocylindrales bacterium]
MGTGPLYLEVFSSDALKRLHGCAVAEVDRGAESPCHGLARAARRPQVGFGNPGAPILFLSPSPIDPSSATGLAFSEWLEREASLTHHMISERVTPYFRFTRAVLLGARDRFAQKAGKQDALGLAFHSWMARCATDNPDRVTEHAISQCSDRHLDAMLGALRPRVIVALGGATARFFWGRNLDGFAQWGPIERLHGTTITHAVDGRALPVILSVHPFQRDVEHRAEAIATALTRVLEPQDLEPAVLKAA